MHPYVAPSRSASPRISTACTCRCGRAQATLPCRSCSSPPAMLR